MNHELEILNRDLAEARERIRRRDQLRSRLQHVRDDLRAERRRLAPLKEELARESADVRRLEGLSLTALFHSILGSKEQQRAKERQEMLAAKLRHDEAAFAVVALVEEQRRGESDLQEVADADQRYQQLLDSKEALLRREDSDVARRLVELADQVGSGRADLKEIQEAQTAGNRARSTLRVIADRLEKAGNWGGWDMVGGGMIATSMKHSHLDEARAQAHVAQRQLRSFEHELEDLGQRLRASLEISPFSKFADWFFDGLVTDWMVQTRIQESLAAAHRTLSKVEGALAKVEARLSEAQERLARTEAERKAFLESA